MAAPIFKSFGEIPKESTIKNLDFLKDLIFHLKYGNIRTDISEYDRHYKIIADSIFILNIENFLSSIFKEIENNLIGIIKGNEGQTLSEKEFLKGFKVRKVFISDFGWLELIDGGSNSPIIIQDLTI